MSDKKRKSFVLHIDSLDILDDLENEQVGMLFRAIKAYQNDEPIELDQLTKMVFLPFKNQFVRDDEKYKTTCERRALAGSKGGKAKVANASNSKQKVAKVANLADSKNKSKNKSDSDSKNKSKNKSDSDSKSDSKSEKKETVSKANHSFEIFQYWCDVMGKNPNTSKLTAQRDKAIKARLKDGYTVEQIKRAIDGCRRDPFSMGQNDRQKAFNDLELICRNGSKLESFFDNQTINNQASQQTFETISNMERPKNEPPRLG